MKIKIELEIEVVITSEDNKEPSVTDSLILKSITKKIGTKVEKMYIDELKITKTEIV
jgi:hypothetical protein